jgi:hypothetical protein
VSTPGLIGTWLTCPGFNGIGSILVILLEFACDIAITLIDELEGMLLVLKMIQSPSITAADPGF